MRSSYLGYMPYIGIPSQLTVDCKSVHCYRGLNLKFSCFNYSFCKIYLSTMEVKLYENKTASALVLWTKPLTP